MGSTAKQAHVTSRFLNKVVGDVVPLYHQIYLILREQILNGCHDAKPLPGELLLASEFQVSRVTIRRALQDLVAEGLIERGRGKGTFAQPREKGHDCRTSSPSGAVFMRLQATGSFTDLQQLSAQRMIVPSGVSALMGLESDAVVEKLVRICQVDGQPIARLTSFIPADVFGLLSRRRLHQQPISILLEEAGVKISTAKQTLSARLADASLAFVLRIPVGAPVLEITRIIFDEAGRVVQLLRGSYRSDRYDYQQEFIRLGDLIHATWAPASPADFPFE